MCDELVNANGGTRSFKHLDGTVSSVQLSHAGFGLRTVRVFNLPFETRNQTISRSLAPFGTVYSVTKEKWSTAYIYQVDNGIRSVRMVVRQHIPSFLMMGGNRAFITYSGQPQTCSFCHAVGHMRNKCPRRQGPVQLLAGDGGATYASVALGVSPSPARRAADYVPATQEVPMHAEEIGAAQHLSWADEVDAESPLQEADANTGLEPATESVVPEVCAAELGSEHRAADVAIPSVSTASECVEERPSDPEAGQPATPTVSIEEPTAQLPAPDTPVEQAPQDGAAPVAQEEPKPRRDRSASHSPEVRRAEWMCRSPSPRRRYKSRSSSSSSSSRNRPRHKTASYSTWDSNPARRRRPGDAHSKPDHRAGMLEQTVRQLKDFLEKSTSQPDVKMDTSPQQDPTSSHLSGKRKLKESPGRRVRTSGLDSGTNPRADVPMAEAAQDSGKERPPPAPNQ